MVPQSKKFEQKGRRAIIAPPFSNINVKVFCFFFSKKEVEVSEAKPLMVLVLKKQQHNNGQRKHIIQGEVF